eukprot:5356430-Prymnesium_polylepis.1
MQKVIKSSGRQPKDLERAVNNRLRKLVSDRKLLRDPRQRLVREAVGAVLRSPDVLEVLRDIAHNFSASFKGASGNTPEDAVYIEQLSARWGKTGSQTARILDLLNVYLLHHLNRKISPQKMRKLFKLAGIKCVKAVNNARDPSDAQYWARRGLKSVKQAFIAIAMWAVYCGGDAKSLKKFGVAGAERREYMMMDVRRTKPDHQGGLDSIGAIGQFAVAVLPVKQYAAVFDGEADGFMAHDLPGWKAVSHFAPREGLAVMVGYNEKEQPETATRNMSSLLKVLTRWPTHFACPTGDVVPLMALECDNGKLSKLFFWLCGILFFALDLTLLPIISNAALWSALGFIETVNGGAATRQSGRVLDFSDLPAPGSARAEELRPHVEAALEKLMAVTDGF